MLQLPSTRRLGLLALSVLTCCVDFNDPPLHYTYATPASDTEFQSSSLADQNITEAPIAEMINKIVRDEFPRIDGVLIFRNNLLVLEEYFHGHDAGIPHNTFSAGKSITSILVGIAVDKGFIANVDVPVISLLPEYTSYENPDKRKSDITVRHLLNMASGLACDDWYMRTEEAMQKSNDWVKFSLDLPMATDPGTQGSYCTGAAVVLGRIIENTSRRSLQQFADKYLFGPLHIGPYEWHIMPDGKASAGGLFFMRPRDMSKIGLLLLNDGQWQGTTIVSSAWVDACRDSQLKLPGPFDGYGYLWWKQAFTGDVQSYFASGNGGQDIFVVPSRNLVVVFTSGNQNTSIGLQSFSMMNDYILPATQ